MTRIPRSAPFALRGAPALAALLLLPNAAAAHVKWFAPYIVGDPPQAIGMTLGNPWFWGGLGLVLAFFLLTRLVEERPLGLAVLAGMDRLSAPLWARADDAMRVIIGGFFVAIFAVGGVYLTPDLQTPAQWVSWMQLLIAGLIFWRPLQPVAAAGIIGLWLLALRDYDLFHLLDYLALGVSVSAYLVLEASGRETWRMHRFEVLRWGVAIALMWSSLEKFAYPEWFSPLVVERPFLTFGLPEAVFVPMAGVAEFTLGFGLLWTALVRRLSAVALFVIFMAAVYPFGRIDFVGHALIMAVIVMIATDPTRQVRFVPAVKRRILMVPPALAVTLAVFVTGYWGTHLAIYGPDGAPQGARTTHAPDPAHPHAADGTDADGSPDPEQEARAAGAVSPAP